MNEKKGCKYENKEKGSSPVSQWKYGDQKPPNWFGGLKKDLCCMLNGEFSSQQIHKESWLGVQVRNMKMVFNIYGTLRQVGQ